MLHQNNGFLPRSRSDAERHKRSLSRTENELERLVMDCKSNNKEVALTFERGFPIMDSNVVTYLLVKLPIVHTWPDKRFEELEKRLTYDYKIIFHIQT